MEEIKQDKSKLELIDANSPPPSESQNITVEKLKKFIYEKVNLVLFT